MSEQVFERGASLNAAPATASAGVLCWLLVMGGPLLLSGGVGAFLPAPLAEGVGLDRCFALWWTVAPLGLALMWPLVLWPSFGGGAQGILRSLCVLFGGAAPAFMLTCGTASIGRDATLSLAVYLALLAVAIGALLWALERRAGGLEAGHRGGFVAALMLVFVALPSGSSLGATLGLARPPGLGLAPLEACRGIASGASLLDQIALPGLLLAIAGILTVSARRAGASLLGLACLGGALGWQSADPSSAGAGLEVLECRALLAGKARAGSAYPLRVRLRKSSPGLWRGWLGVELGRRRSEVFVQLAAGPELEQVVELSLAPSRAGQAVLTARVDGFGPRRLPARIEPIELVPERELLIAARGEGAESLLARIPKTRLGAARTLAVAPSSTSLFRLGGDACDAVLVTGALAPAERAALRAYVGRGGLAVMLEGPAALASLNESRDGALAALDDTPGSWSRAAFGAGAMIAPSSAALEPEALAAALTRELGAGRSTQFDSARLYAVFEQAAPSGSAVLGRRLAMALLLLLIAQALFWLGLRRPIGGAPSLEGCALWLLLSMVAGAFAEGLVVPSSPLLVETVRVERGSVGGATIFEQTLTRVEARRPTRDCELLWRSPMAVAPLGAGELCSGQRRASEQRLLFTLDAKQTLGFVSSDLRRFGAGLSVERSGGEIFVENQSPGALRHVALVLAGKAAYLGALAVGERRALESVGRGSIAELLAPIVDPVARGLARSLLEGARRRGEGVLVALRSTPAAPRALGGVGLERSRGRLVVLAVAGVGARR